MSYTQAYPIDYTSTGNNIGKDDINTGAVKRIEGDLKAFITAFNTLETSVNLNSGEDMAFFFSELGG